MHEVKLPKTTDEEVESLIVFWFKSEGDKVEKGDVLVEIQTEKATFEIEAEESGVLNEILVQRGDVASVGDVLATLATGVESVVNEKQAMAPADQQAPYEEQEKPQFVRVSPRIRRLARELGVDLASVKGTGKNGLPTEEDVRKQAQQSTGKDYKVIPLAGIRKTIAKRMSGSLHSTAQLTETAWADVTLLDGERKRIQGDLSWNDILLFAATKALQEHPDVNAHVFEAEIHQYGKVHLGVAVDADEGLFVPVVKNADELGLMQLKDQVRQIVEKAKQQMLSAEEMSGATFTVTNLGGFGIQFFTPIINQPEAAILGVGKIETDAVLESGQVRERKRLPLSLTFDHRAIDGAPAARFLQTLIGYLQDPAKLLEEVFAK
ncbi:dihydrolipoamide acetyltransferase family protein [Peribacillus glennii]|uniref:Dihydrolipoamide acetyltransferase component of pyruvate dehydrogenase complex n=1 Tax=Peribacillus glennii TaxID=2303991 RepID=A0A372LJK1_9BACI|nr:dihydrolipoamide acetyltransferase family protein [Peribacillus glennii]RFU66662.1 2-oxo acid dehydrogenase subunit E2 [Peribacillus glennii]